MLGNFLNGVAVSVVSVAIAFAALVGIQLLLTALGRFGARKAETAEPHRLSPTPVRRLNELKNVERAVTVSDANGGAPPPEIVAAVMAAVSTFEEGLAGDFAETSTPGTSVCIRSPLVSTNIRRDGGWCSVVRVEKARRRLY